MSNNITFRTGLGRPLTHTELDNNFRYLHDWKPNTAYKKDMYVEYEVNGEINLYKAKFDIPALAFFNSSDWKKFGAPSENSSTEIISDKFTYATGTVESPFSLSKIATQILAVEINGNDIVNTDDFTYDSNNNQVFYLGTLYSLSDGDSIVIKYTTSDSISEDTPAASNNKNVRAITPAEAASIEVLKSDEYISILTDNLVNGCQLNLPEDPKVGQKVTIVDGSGNAGGLTISINADAADTIENNNSINVSDNWFTKSLIYIGNNIWKNI